MSAAPETGSVRIRRFDPDTETATVLALIAESFGPMVLDPPSGALSETTETIRGRGPHEPVLVAEAGGRLVGCIFCRLRDDALYVGRLAVTRHFRRSGVGAVLLDAAGDLACAAGLPAIGANRAA